MQKSLAIDLRLIVKNRFCLFVLLLYVLINTYGHVKTLTVERDLNHKSNGQKYLFEIKCKSMYRDFRL